MKLRKRILLLIIGAVLFPFESFTQDLGNIKVKDIAKISGGIGFQSTAYTAWGVPMNRDPFLMQVNLNLNISVLGVINIPFSASFSNQGSKYSTPQPFNTFGMSPKYKAVTLHVGYRSLNLSEFSLSGSQFLGVGLEVQPKNSFVKGKVLWGRFAKPIYYNPNGTIATQPSYERFGWGMGVTLGKTAKNEVSFNIFNAKDNPNSLAVSASEIDTKPAENLVLGVTFKQEITKKLSVDGEGDMSFFTSNITLIPDIDNNNSYANNIFLFKYNGSSEFKKAIMFGVNYKPSFAKFSLKYRRVDPGYRTLGISFINNDYEDVSLKTSFSLFDKKTSVSLSGGLQKNNLNNEKVSQLLRLIGSINVNHKLSDKWNASANYANFNSNTHQTIVITFDSLKFVQTTQSAGLSLSRSQSSETSSSSLNISFAYQDAIVNGVRTTNFYNGNIGWQKQFIKSKISLGASLVAMHNIAETGSTSNIGPATTFGTVLLKNKLVLNLVAAYLPSFIDLKSAGTISNLALSGSYAIYKKHKIGFSVTNVMRNTADLSSTELTAAINYKYSF